MLSSISSTGRRSASPIGSKFAEDLSTALIGRFSYPGTSFAFARLERDLVAQIHRHRRGGVARFSRGETRDRKLQHRSRARGRFGTDHRNAFSQPSHEALAIGGETVAAADPV